MHDASQHARMKVTPIPTPLTVYILDKRMELELSQQLDVTFYRRAFFEKKKRIKINNRGLIL